MVLALCEFAINVLVRHFIAISRYLSTSFNRFILVDEAIPQPLK